MGTATMEEHPILEEIADQPPPEVMRTDVEEAYRTNRLKPYDPTEIAKVTCHLNTIKAGVSLPEIERFRESYCLALYEDNGGD